jgi:Mg2+-importing ATPase
MLVFGLLSSVFDYATFGVLLLLLHAKPAEFRTGWLIESVASASLVVLVIRTRRPIFRSAPSWKLLTATVLVVAVVIIIPFTPLSGPLGMTRIPAVFFGALAGILVVYAFAAEVTKWLFYRAHERRPVPAAIPAARRASTHPRRPTISK